MNARRLREEALELLVRPAVSVRTRSVPDGVVYYLSMYDEEIDERAEAHFQSFSGPARTAWRDLELTDTAVLVSRPGQVRVARGGAASFPIYWSRRSPGLVLSTHLPVEAGEPLSRRGLVAAVAGACVHGSYEPNGFTVTPLADWRRCRRGSVTHFADSALVTEHVIDPLLTDESVSRDTVACRVRSALDTYAESQRSVPAALLELSGGYDSTLAAAPPVRPRMRGVSVVFPYYEFRFEHELQRTTADFLGIERAELDGTELAPFAPADQPARFDAPSVFVTGIRHAEQVARLAEAQGAKRIYMGHGGDQCFATDLLAEEEWVPNPPTRDPFSADAWRVVGGALDAMRGPTWRQRRLGTFVADAAQDVWVKEMFGATVRTPFSDLGLFRAAVDWSRWCRARTAPPDKTILAEAAHDLLPAAVVNRKGKVAYDGVWMRARRSQAERVANVFEEVRSVFDRIGVSTDWLLRRVLELGAWRRRSDREVLALYGVAYWLSAWGLTNAGDITWAD